MNRLLCVSALILLLGGPGGATAANDSAARPNFLFILADDHAVVREGVAAMLEAR